MALSKKTYDTDSIVLRRILALNPLTNGRISANTVLVTGSKGVGSFQDTVGFLSTLGVPTSITSLGQIYNSTILVAGTNITFSSNANQITINGGSGIAATDLTSTTMGLGTLGYLSTTQLVSTIVNLGQIYNSTILVAGTNITFSSNVNQITINGQACGGGGDIVATDLTSTTMGLGTLGYLSTSQLASTIVNLGQIYNSTILVAGTNISFTSNANQITINGEAGGGGGDVTAINLTSTTMGLGSLGYLSTTQLASTIVNLGQIYNSTILVAGTNISFTSNANQITINGQAGGGGGDVTALNLTSTTKGLGSLGYLSSISGFNSGTTYFLNWSQAGSTYPYKALQPTITGGSQQSDVNTIPTNTDQVIQTFQTSIIHPSFIPAGMWDLNIFVRSASSYLSVYYKIFKLNDGTSTQIGQNSLPVTIFPADGSTIVQVILSIAVPYTILDDGEGDTVYIQIRGVNSDLSFTHELAVYYEGDRYSHLHTTFLQSVTELSTITGLGSLGYISTASLFSSIEGLGTFGYLSSFNTISSANLSSGSVYASLLSSQQITASSITANKFVGDGSLITNLPNLGVTSITAGTGIGVNTTTGAVTVSNSGVLSIEQGEGISITGSEGSYTITATGGTAGTIATADMVSTVIGIQLRATSSLTSSLQGLSYMGYLSSFATISSLNISTGSIYASLLSSQQITVSSIRANKFVGDGSLLVNVPGTGGLATIDLTSTVTGLGTSGYLSSLTLLSTIENLGQIYNSTILVAGTNITFSSNINQITINGQAGGGGGLAASDLTSTTMGLGSISYISSFNTLSSLNISSGSIYTSTTSTTETNAGRLNFGELYNNGTKLIDAYGNILFSFQTL
jgi:hypothetical protein